MLQKKKMIFKKKTLNKKLHTTFLFASLTLNSKFTSCIKHIELFSCVINFFKWGMVPQKTSDPEKFGSFLSYRDVEMLYWDLLKERQLCFILGLCLVPVASSCWWCRSLLGFSFSYRALWRRITTWFRMWENRAKRKAMAAVTCLDPKTQHHTTWTLFGNRFTIKIFEYISHF